MPFMVVGLISKDFWFYSDGCWTVPRKEAKTAAFSVPHFSLKALIETVFNQDFDCIKKNIWKVMDSKKSQHLRLLLMMVNDTIKIWHKVGAHHANDGLYQGCTAKLKVASLKVTWHAH